MSTLSDHAVGVDGYGPDDVIPPRELHHVTFKTNRLDQMMEFYAVLTGHQPTFHGKKFGTASFDVANHRIALLHVTVWEERAPERAAVTVGLHHVGYEYGTLDGLLHTYARLKRRGIEPEWTVNHGPTLSFYYRDPDGNGIELQVDNCGHDVERWKAFFNGYFEQNQMGVNIDPEKLIEARARGVTDEDIAADSYTWRDNPYAAPGFGPPGMHLALPPGLEL